MTPARLTFLCALRRAWRDAGALQEANERAVQATRRLLRVQLEAAENERRLESVIAELLQRHREDQVLLAALGQEVKK